MNVLLLTQAFPPAPVVGAFRPQLLAKGPRGERPSGTRAQRRERRRRHSRRAGARRAHRGGEAVSWPRRVVRRGPAACPERPGGDLMPQGKRERLGRRSGLRCAGIAVGLLSTPDDLQGYVPGAIAAAIRNRSFHPDLIYSTAPAFSIHLAGLVLERVFRVPWIAEFRDPWVENASPRPASDSGVSARLDRWLEARVVSRASGIVSVTAAASNRLKQRYPAKTTPRAFITALNGIDQIRDRRAAPRRGRYPCGSFTRAPYTRRVTRLRCSGASVKSLPRAGCWTRPSSATSTTRRAHGSRGVWLGSDVRLRFVEWLPRAEAPELIRDADLLLLPAQAWSLQVPGKLYDYLGSRVPIFALVEPGSETESHAGSRRRPRDGGGGRTPPAGTRDSRGAAHRGRAAAARRFRQRAARVVDRATVRPACRLDRQPRAGVTYSFLRPRASAAGRSASRAGACGRGVPRRAR